MNRSESPNYTSLWDEGWYRLSRRMTSPNYGPRPPETQIDLIVLHSISLPPGKYGGEEVQQLFSNQLDCEQHPYFKSIQGLQVSAHFYIRRDGQLIQFVSCNDRAWHAGASCYRGKNNCNDYSIGIELEGTEGDSFENSQYKTLTSLCVAILQHYPIMDIAGHQHVAPGRKSDPGEGFNWSLLQQSVGLEARYLPEDYLRK